MTKSTEKKVYSTPQLTVHGGVVELTQASSKVPTSLDATFPTGTPFGSLTFNVS